VNTFGFLDELYIPKTRVLGLSVGEDFVIIACVILTQYQRETDIPMMANTGLAWPAMLTPCKNWLRGGGHSSSTNNAGRTR